MRSSLRWKSRKKSIDCCRRSRVNATRNNRVGTGGGVSSPPVPFKKYMKHRSKVEVWLFAAILYVVGVLAAGGNRWIGGPVLLVLLLIALPQEYVTAPEALRVRTGLTRWAIPYQQITFLGESSLGPVLGKRISLRVGGGSEIL